MLSVEGVTLDCARKRLRLSDKRGFLLAQLNQVRRFVKSLFWELQNIKIVWMQSVKQSEERNGSGTYHW